MRWRLVIPLLALGALALAATGALLARGGESSGISVPPPGLYRGSEPPGMNLLPSFSLPRFDGGRINSTSLRGKVVLVTFVDSACTETCPIIISLLGRALPQLAAAERSQVAALAISVDPPADTTAHVRNFLTQRGALGKLSYLVAPTHTMKPVWKGFYILSAVESGNADTHSSSVRIFSRTGKWVSTLNAGADLNIANLLHDLREAMRAAA